MSGPFLDTSSSELPLLVPNEHRSLDEGAGWNHIRIVHLESHRLQIVLDIAGQDELKTFELFRKQSQFVAAIKVSCDLLPKIRDVTHRPLAVDKTRNRMTLSVGCFDDRGAVMVGDIVEPKRNTMACQDVPDRDAEGGPRKLDEGEHGFYMTEATRNCKR